MGNGHSMQEQECPECFGRFQEGKSACAECPYPESCRFYRDNPPPKDPYARFSRGHYASIDQYGYSEELATDFELPDEGNGEPQEDETPLTREDLKSLLHFLLYAIDEYTLAIVLEMLRTGQRDTVELAKAFGVSKQAMHRKIQDMATAYPELRSMLELTMRKCASLASPEARRSIAGRNPHNRESKADDARKEEGKQPEQLMLF